MPDSDAGESGPLERLTEGEIAHLLRGFPDGAISSARSLRTGSGTAEIEACLLGILIFYLPAGSELPEIETPGSTRIRDDLGLDSLSIAEAMFKVEELFEIRVENEELAEILTIADARRLLVEKLETPTSVADA